MQKSTSFLIPNTEYIQRKFFRTGPYTHMHIEHNPGLNHVRWVFTFMDFGMCHTIESIASVEQLGESTLVDGALHHSLDSVCHALFGNRYARYVEELYADIGMAN